MGYNERFLSNCKKISNLFDLLEDQQSKDIFLARLQCDIDSSFENLAKLFGASAQLNSVQLSEQLRFENALNDLEQEKKKVIIYGTGALSSVIGARMISRKIPFSGFCSRNIERYKNGFMGKPVYSHEFLIENVQDSFLLIPDMDHYDVAVERLKLYGFPMDRILPYFCGKFLANKKSYFEFPQFFKHGTAFVDGGSYDGMTSVEFAEWCHNEYSKIFAFEPDCENIVLLNRTIERAGLQNIELHAAGLGKENEVLAFMSGKGYSSCIVSERTEDTASKVEYINIVSLDNVVGEEKIGLIKLDIEGAEYDALQGAQKVIMRDKPLLAICVYHRSGDQLAIMEYLHSLVPEYKFWLRHYSTSNLDTVLYAAVPQ